MLNLLIFACLLYVSLLFSVAFIAEKAAARGRGRWLRNAWVYTLSISIYCTAWTFYGAVGYAARSGLEFATIYLGPSLVMFGWWWVLRKLVRIGRTQRVTSIADLLSSRFGKSNSLAALITVLAVIGTTPYIALQLQSVTLAFEVFAVNGNLEHSGSFSGNTALLVAAGLALFTIVFGTRNLDANERHYGVVIAIAVESIVKLLALLSVGAFVVWGIMGGVAEALQKIDQSTLAHWNVDNSRWVSLTVLSAAAFLCLPRMFQVLVVENDAESHLGTASWAFPLYLLLMSLFVVPIAVAGLDILPSEANPDLFVLTLPLSQGQDGLAILAFLGGFSSATSMVIVASIALSTMISNHLVMPVFLHFTGNKFNVSRDLRRIILIIRRLSIVLILFLGYLYFILSGGGEALASIGLVSFTGVVQVLPALLGGLFWRGATRVGALCGVGTGFAIWLYTLFIPSFGFDFGFSSQIMANGPYGISWLRPQALFGISGLDPLVHAVFWSISLNSLLFLLVSLVSFPAPLERLQALQFVNAFDNAPSAHSWNLPKVQSEDLMVMAQRILGSRDARALFAKEVDRQGGVGLLPEPTFEFLQRLERALAGSVGTATAHAMVGKVTGRLAITVQDLMAVADETAQMLEYSSKLELQSYELERTAGQLRSANEKLTNLSEQKDTFLSQISHELRTPMTSILSFSEILRDGPELSSKKLKKYMTIIHEEALRLTQVLDDLLDLSVLEKGQVNLQISKTEIEPLLQHAVFTVGKGSAISSLKLNVQIPHNFPVVETDAVRLGQVFINLISNAVKYCEASKPSLTIKGFQLHQKLIIDFIDNGKGIPEDQQDLIFEKFSRIGDQNADGSGLGLAICKEIMRRLGGSISYLAGQGGGAFRVELPLNSEQRIF